LVEAQQSLYVEAFKNAFECGTMLLQLAQQRTAQKAGMFDGYGEASMFGPGAHRGLEGGDPVAR
jgi:hypothetical protein